MGTLIMPREQLPDDPKNIVQFEEDPVVFERLLVQTKNGDILQLARSDLPKAVPGTPGDLAKQRGWRPVLSVLDSSKVPDFYDWACRTHEAIFRYFFRYPSSRRDIVHAFCGAVRDDWSSTVRDEGVPAAWDEQQADSGEYLLEYDATLAAAIQYSREESIAQQVDDFGEVDFAKIMSPAIDWSGMELTDPTDDTKKTYAPGDLHLTDDTSLQGQTHTQVTRSDLISHWGLSFS